MGPKVRRRGAIATSVGVAQAAAPECGEAAAPAPPARARRAAAVPGVTKIKHVVVLMQENRSYDSYFGQLNTEGQPNSPFEPTTGNPDPIDAG